VMVDGLDALAKMRAFHARAVTLMRLTEAVHNYGQRARNGAIVVVTKRGRR
jgi:hypothetical protein